MSIETLLERIANSLEDIAGALSQGTQPATSAKADKPAKPEKPAKPAKPTKPTPPADDPDDADDDGSEEEEEDLGPVDAGEEELTENDVRKALVALQKATGSPDASREILKTIGKVATIAKLDVKLYGKVIDAAKKKTAK